jgi:hypothetical protein
MVAKAQRRTIEKAQLKSLSGGLRRPHRCSSCQRLEHRVANLSTLLGYLFASCLNDEEARAFARGAELNVEGFLRGRQAGRGSSNDASPVV